MTYEQAWKDYPLFIQKYILSATYAMHASIRIGDAEGAKKYFKLAARQIENHSAKLRMSWLGSTN